MVPMSRAEPGRLRNRTSPKAPITAMPVPRLPFTSRMTICTISGSSATVTTNPLATRFLYCANAAHTSPSTSAVPLHIASWPSVKAVPANRTLSSMSHILL